MGPELALTVVCCETPISDVLSMRLALPLHPWRRVRRGTAAYRLVCYHKLLRHQPPKQP